MLLPRVATAEAAPPWLTFQWFDDVVEEKGVALMRADYREHDEFKTGDALFVANLLTLYYLDDEKARPRALSFNQGPGPCVD